MAEIQKTDDTRQLEMTELPASPQGLQYLAIDEAMHRQVLNKLDRNLIPLITALYLCSILDRGNIGNAQTAGMSKSLNQTDAQYQWLLTIFYIPYILFEWGALMWKLLPPHIWAFATVFTWGLCATLQGAAVNWQGMMALRFFIAAAEACYGPGLPYLLSFFYMRGELGFRCGMFLSASPLANCFAGALAYGITSGHAAIDAWRVLFIVEGIPTICMAFVAFFFLPDSPEKARFLNEEEKRVANARAIRQVGVEGHERIGTISFKDIGYALLDIKNWLTALMYFSVNVSFASLPVFLPTILTGMGFTSINAQGLSAPPYFLAFLVSLSSTYIADRTQQRGYVIAFTSLVAAIGYTVLATVQATGPRYFAVYLVCAGAFPAIFNIAPWTLNNQGSDSKRGTGIVLLQMFGSCGPILGTRLYPAAQGPYYVPGMAICAGFLYFSAALALALRFYLAWENKRAAEREALIVAAGDGNEKLRSVGLENEGFGFRNIL